MSVIFPTSPAKVKLHNLPKNSEYVTYQVGENLTISVWLPDGYRRIEQENEVTNDDFYYRHCEDCERNCYSFLNQYEDEETGDVDWDHPDLHGHCNVYDDGYHGQPCPLGYEEESDTIEFDISPMVFEVVLSHIGESERFSILWDSAYLCAGNVDESGVFRSTEVAMAANVFGNEDQVEKICWGGNMPPNNLREIVTDYFSTPFNNDLTPICAFEENVGRIRNEVYCENFYPSDDKILAEGGPDTLALVDAEKDVTAFFHLLAAGYKPLPEAPHVMIIPLYERTIQVNGNSYSGYVSNNDSVGKQWFFSTDGELIGQCDPF
jgi:hypothetical protein